MEAKETYVVYLLECADGRYYCGITNNLERRIKVHNSGKGAKALRGHLPVKLLVHSGLMTVGDALRFERFVKSRPRNEKISLVDNEKR